MRDVLGVTISKGGISIKLTYKQWTHIIESHDYMAGNLDLVLETVEIYCSWLDR